MKAKFTKIVLAIIMLSMMVLILKALSFTAAPFVTKSQFKTVKVDSDIAVNNLSQAIQFKTVSHEDVSKFDSGSFNDFLHWLSSTYPDIYQQLELKRINQYSLLFRWQGKTPNKAAVLMSAHYDVVPVISGTEQQWSYPPFSGQVSDGFIWGRGAMDDKGAAIAMLESVNTLLSQKFTPDGDIYIALTHDEEIGSEYGSKAIVEWFKQQNIKLAWSLDEGSAILDSIIPGVEKKVAMINVAEKGYLNLAIVANAQGGHSSMPPKETAVSILSEAIVKLKNNPLPGGLTGVSANIYDNMGRHMSFGYRFLFANTWLFKSLIERVMSDLPSGNAMLRTTTAPTMLNGSVKSNVLPITATAVVNFRIHPRDSAADVVKFVKNSINDNRVAVNIITAVEPSKVSSQTNPGFTIIAESARHIYEDAIVTAGISVAGTDSRYYSRITDSFRFNPIVMTTQDLTGMHGTNERIKIDNYINAIRFYGSLMQQL